MANKILIVGLGNPGKEYKGTSHNAGFETIDRLIALITDNKLQMTKDEKGFAEIWRTKIGKNEVVLVKPLLFMNKSGSAIKKLVTDYGLRIMNYEIIVVHDDADLPLGSIRLSYNAGSAGHKGVEDVIRAIKTKEFWRFRVGTMPTAKRPQKRPKALMQKFVTQKLSGANKKKLEKSADLAAQLIRDAILGGKIEAERKNYTI